METRADIDAALHQIIGLGKRESFIVQSEHLPPIVEERFFALTVAICSYFFITSPDAYGNVWTERSSHPHPYLRLSELSDFIVVSLKQSQPELAQNWYQGYIRALHALTDAWKHIGMGSLGLAAYFDDMERVESVSSRLAQARNALAGWSHYDLRDGIPSILRSQNPRN
jgi:hypothetical protein